MRDEPYVRGRQAKRWVVVYDVSDDRRRERVATALLDAGVRVGLSVFEARLSTRQAHAVLARLRSLIDPATDRVSCYRLCLPCAGASLHEGCPWPRTSDAVQVF